MASRNHFPFTEAKVRALPTPATGRAWWYDTKARGLCVCKTPTGAASFYFYKWHNGKPKRELVGKFPDLSVQQARDAAETRLGAIAAGGDPFEERRSRRREPTLVELFAHWMIHARAHKRPKSYNEDERQYNALLKPWAGRRLSTIRKTDVQELHAHIGRENGIYMSNRLLALLSAMFGKADDIGYRGGNPCKGVTKFKETSRDRWLQADELQRFFAALETEPNRDVRDYFIVSLFSGARKSNVLAMRWEDVNLNTALWRIPGEDAKAGQPIVIPLVEPLVVLLRERLARNGTSPWVFPNSRGDHMAEPRGAWSRIIARAEITDVRPHDLRRTLGSWQAMTGATLLIIGKMLGHRAQVTTAIYARLDVNPVRMAAERAIGAMLAAGGQTKLLEAHSAPHTEGSSDEANG